MTVKQAQVRNLTIKTNKRTMGTRPKMQEEAGRCARGVMMAMINSNNRMSGEVADSNVREEHHTILTLHQTAQRKLGDMMVITNCKNKRGMIIKITIIITTAIVKEGAATRRMEQKIS